MQNDIRQYAPCAMATRNDPSPCLTAKDFAALADIALLFERRRTATVLVDSLYRYFDGHKLKRVDRVLSELTHAVNTEKRPFVFSSDQLLALLRAATLS